MSEVVVELARVAYKTVDVARDIINVETHPDPPMRRTSFDYFSLRQKLMADIEDMFSQAFELAIVTHIDEIKAEYIKLSIIIKDSFIGTEAIRRTIVVNTTHNCIYIHQ